MPKAFRKMRNYHSTAEMNRRWEKKQMPRYPQQQYVTETGLTRAEWFKLPIQLRQRWWAETGFGQNKPSEELQQAIKAALGK